MKADRWQQIEALYHDALELEETERARFLGRACASDEGLRREVESLLAYESRAGKFIEAPALEVAASILARDNATSLLGETVGSYKIISLLGAGGMGEVFLADDTKLGRKIALKLLPREFTQNPERVRRFEQEARAASALNHPNIITIFDIGQADDTHFIATEYIRGVTLREQMKIARISLHQVLDVACQMANALAAAHETRIVHRDIKPENIMLRTDG